MSGPETTSNQKAARRPCAWLAALLVTSFAPVASADVGGVRILYFEPFDTTIDPRPRLAQKPSDTRVVRFEAYGKRFEATLEPNQRLEQARPSSSTPRVRLYRGQLSGIPGSWARLATHGSNVHGLIWDGTELYVIEPAESIRDSLVPPLDASGTRTVLFSLADTILDEGASFCAASSPPIDTGRDSYAATRRELGALKQQRTRIWSKTGDLRLELSAVADAAFRAQFVDDATAIDQILLQLNNVDGIFTAELGVEIQVPTTLIDDGTAGLADTTSPPDLLRSLAAWRARSPLLHARGLTHLFTGRDLDGTTAGIGYVDTLCDPEFGVALTEVRNRGVWLESLVAAHEIGHNFGAEHDGEPGECSHEPQNTFLMSPTVHPTASTFSSCSRNRIAQTIMNASCVAPLPPADLAIPADLGSIRAAIGEAFDWELPVTNVGGRTTELARIEVLVPGQLDILDAWIPGGTCTSGASAVDCEFSGIAGGVTRKLSLTLRGNAVGSHVISARILAATDSQTDNNDGAGTIEVSPKLVPGDDPPPATTPAAAGAGGTASGGGAFGATFALALLLIGIRRHGSCRWFARLRSPAAP